MLGLLQGLTEFFPVSSSGHLGLGALLLGMEEEGATTEVALHAGTLFAVLVFLARPLLELTRGLFGAGAPEQNASARRTILLVGVASVPAAVIGLLLGDQIEALFDSAWVIAAGFFATGGLLLSSRRFRAADADLSRLSFGAALVIGFAQVLAMVPGISRSGSTIVTAMALGIRPSDAGRFSFLMAIPVISGATVLKLGDILDTPPGAGGALAIGVVCAFVFGLLALGLLTRMLRRGRFDAFAWYVIPLGLLTCWVAGRSA